MLWTITVLTFLTTLGIAGALFYAFMPGKVKIAGRLSRLLSPDVPVEETEFSVKQKERLQNSLASIGKLVSSPGSQSSKTQLLMTRAGYRSSDAVWAMRGVKVLMPANLGGAGLLHWALSLKSSSDFWSGPPARLSIA